uniref:Atp4 n=1 Tax=Gelidiella acerosa TaxID=28867 RepID=A0A7G9IVP0_9FLOR|nr:Atp4 [Gelidiella acerosa]QNM39434.1 Atp4 [Gelidiella acerosa]
MLNFSIISFITLILISQNIILLNEEILILICFITFIWLLLSKTSSLMKKDLNEQASAIQNSLENSFNQIIVSLDKEWHIQNEFKSLTYNFELLKAHFVELNLFISDKLSKFALNNYQEAFKKKLIFVQRLENQTSKLLALLVVKKLNKAIALKTYYLTTFQLPILTCTYKISLREFFKVI